MSGNRCRGWGGALYEHDLSGCLASTIGSHGLSDTHFTAALVRTAPALERLRAWQVDGSCSLLTLPGRRDDLAVLAPLVDVASRKFTDLVVLGTGGSTLGGRALAALVAHPVPPAQRAWLHFSDAADGHDFGVLIDGLDLERSLFVVISKSGATDETLTQFLIAFDAVKAAVSEEELRGAFLVVTKPGENPLRRLAERWRLPVLDHDPGLGGRYSVFSAVGLLPAMFAGIDAEAVRAGAAEALTASLAAERLEDCEPARGAALLVGLAEECDISTTVLMPYCSRLAELAAWHRQLWAESLGKNGLGTTPVSGLGPIDQHSQLQLYLDGPHDKLLTLLTLDSAGRGRSVEPDLIADEPELAHLAHKTLGNMVEAAGDAMADALTAAGRPLRRISIEDLDERRIGGLLMHFMLETIIAAELLGVDPFDQPAVEAVKVRVRTALAEAGSG
jgi:glucose-6-phosphate isomerase